MVKPLNGKMENYAPTCTERKGGGGAHVYNVYQYLGCKNEQIKKNPKNWVTDKIRQTKRNKRKIILIVYRFDQITDIFIYRLQTDQILSKSIRLGLF